MTTPTPNLLAEQIADTHDALDIALDLYSWAYPMSHSKNVIGESDGGSGSGTSDQVGSVVVSKADARSRVREASYAVQRALNEARRARSLLDGITNSGKKSPGDPMKRVTKAELEQAQAAKARRVARGEDHGDESLSCVTRLTTP